MSHTLEQQADIGRNATVKHFVDIVVIAVVHHVEAVLELRHGSYRVVLLLQMAESICAHQHQQ